MGRTKTISDDVLLALARAVFLEHGPGAATRLVAERAGISEAAVFQRFQTKSKLYLAAMLSEQRAPVDLVAHGVAETKAALKETAMRLLAYFREVIPTTLQLATNPAVELKDIGGYFGPERTGQVAQELADFMAQRAAQGECAPTSPIASAQLLIAAVHSLAVYEVLGLHGGSDMGHAVPYFVDELWQGLAPVPSPPR